MTASVQQDAMLGNLAVLAYDDLATVNQKLATDTTFAGWSVLDTKVQDSFVAYTFIKQVVGEPDQVAIAYRGTA
jgi:hypothetical protein